MHLLQLCMIVIDCLLLGGICFSANEETPRLSFRSKSKSNSYFCDRSTSNDVWVEVDTGSRPLNYCSICKMKPTVEINKPRK